MSLANPAFVAMLGTAETEAAGDADGFEFLSHPEDAFPMVGGLVYLSVTTNQTSANVAFQWKQADTADGTYANVSGSEFSGADTATLRVSIFDQSLSGKHFKCSVTHSTSGDPAGSPTSGSPHLSNSATIVVDSGL